MRDLVGVGLPAPLFTDGCRAGRAVCRVDTLIKLAGALGVEPGELLEGLEWEPGGTRLGLFREARNPEVPEGVRPTPQNG